MIIYNFMKTPETFSVGFGKEDIEFTMSFKCPKEYAYPEKVENVTTDCKEDTSKILKKACTLYNNFSKDAIDGEWCDLCIPEKYIEALITEQKLSCTCNGNSILEDEFGFGENACLDDYDEDFQELVLMLIEDGKFRKPSIYLHGDLDEDTLEVLNYLNQDDIDVILDFSKKLYDELNYSLLVHCGTIEFCDMVHDVYYDFYNKNFFKRNVDFSYDEISYAKEAFILFKERFWKE